MTTIRANGVRFKLYPQDHLPCHAHGLYQGTEVIVELGMNGIVTLANRDDAIQPRNASRNTVRTILQAAAEHFDVIVDAWEDMHE